MAAKGGTGLPCVSLERKAYHVAKQCWQLSALACKLKTLEETVEMARLTGLPLRTIANQAQMVRTENLLLKAGRTLGYVLPLSQRKAPMPPAVGWPSADMPIDCGAYQHWVRPPIAHPSHCPPFPSPDPPIAHPSCRPPALARPSCCPPKSRVPPPWQPWAWSELDGDQQRRIKWGVAGHCSRSALQQDGSAGLHKEPVAVLDFASLYPSVFIAHNICFSTVLPPRAHSALAVPFHRTPSTVAPNSCVPGAGGDTVRQWPGDAIAFVTEETHVGLFPRLLRTLLQERRAVKKRMKEIAQTDSQLAAVLDARQARCNRCDRCDATPGRPAAGTLRAASPALRPLSYTGPTP